jgi:hypothetical protein
VQLQEPLQGVEKTALGIAMVRARVLAAHGTVACWVMVRSS